VYRSLLDVVKTWNPDDPEIPSHFEETLIHFNYSDPLERSYAAKFRDAELPFKVYDIPEFNAVSSLWTDDYLLNILDTPGHRRRNSVEKSKNNHFLFWGGRTTNRIKGWEPPTEIIDMSFREWLALAKDAESKKLSNSSVHYYFTTGSPAFDTEKDSIASKDLPLFATEENNFFITDVDSNKGIQCRFGMRGVIAESHYDTGRNMVAMLKGNKRYILNPPYTCKQLGIIADQAHPSYRHSILDWSDVNQATSRGFARVDAIDTILRTGEVLYIPSYWFHYIISLDYSAQCNSRSGTPPRAEGQADIESCFGFKLSPFRGNSGRRKRLKGSTA
jgi:Cupin-like domain